MAPDDGMPSGVTLPKVLSMLAGPDRLLRVDGSFFLELFCGLASLTLACMVRGVPAVCPWDSTYGDCFDVFLQSELLLTFAASGRLAVCHLGMPCQSFTWARSPAIRSWYDIWGFEDLKGQSLSKVVNGNSLLIWSLIFCHTLCFARSYFVLESEDVIGLGGQAYFDGAQFG